MFKHLLAMAIAATIATSVSAGNWTIAVPDTLPGGGEALKSLSWQFFLRNTGPGDDLTVLNATKPGQIAAMSIPKEPMFESPKRRARAFGAENRQIAGYFDQLGEDAPVTDVLGVLRHISLNRIDPSRPLDVMIIGSAAQRFAKTPRLSMPQEDGLYVPSPEHLAATVSETGYGMGAEGRNGLKNVFVHICPVADDLRPDEEAALQSVYADYVAARGGTLVTWSDDLPTCFARFAAEVRTPIEVEPYAEATGEMRMVKVGAAEVVVEVEKTPLVIGGVEVEQFNIFSSAPHPTLSGVEVTTGVVYDPEVSKTRYTNAYCYFNIQKSASSLRLDLGNKYPGQSVVWEDASGAALREAGINRSDFEAGRNACQWPTP